MPAEPGVPMKMKKQSVKTRSERKGHPQTGINITFSNNSDKKKTTTNNNNDTKNIRVLLSQRPRTPEAPLEKR